ncbi:MAG: cob(I)yrinic acid a,c-diamide adenosyltransferase [Verrucomicrobiales bacterium]|nr:cob(I)yrinic acid a,c-diamide adenosyltransferase [Verrucomicrobiales bacterium]
MRSIVTRTGDAGTTSLMFNRRVPKHHPRVEAYGVVDELNAALGLARARVPEAEWKERILQIQRELILFMGELATDTADRERYLQAGYGVLETRMATRLEGWIAALEARLPVPQGWSLPGADEVSAALHVARTVCRRAERKVSALLAAGDLPNTDPLTYLNRLGDLLWLWARQAETAD